MRPHTITALAAALAATWVSSAWAEDGTTFRFSGFGTVGAVQSSEKNADFTSLITQPNGAGHTRNPAFSPDSKLGGQVDAKFNPEFSATVQAAALLQNDNSYRPDLMLAFAKWQATPTLALRAGRLSWPLFLISDYRSVGYSLPWARPPVDFYHLVSAYHYDGVDATWSTMVGDVALKSQIYYAGKGTADTADAAITIDRSLGVNVTAESGPSTYRLSYVNLSKTTVSSGAIEAAFQGVRFGLPADALGPGSPALPASPALADQYEIRDETVRYYTAGFNYDPGEWFVMTELATANSVGFFPRQSFGYATAGLHRGDFTPYATLSAAHTKPAPLSGHPIVDALVQGAAAIGRKSLGAGLRWDARKNLTLKFQLDHTKLDEGSSGTLRNLQPGFQTGSSFNVLSATLDFVF